MVERILRWYGTTRGARSASLRYFNAGDACFGSRIGEDWTYSSIVKSAYNWDRSQV